MSVPDPGRAHRKRPYSPIIQQVARYGAAPAMALAALIAWFFLAPAQWHGFGPAGRNTVPEGPARGPAAGQESAGSPLALASRANGPVPGETPGRPLSPSEAAAHRPALLAGQRAGAKVQRDAALNSGDDAAHGAGREDDGAAPEPDDAALSIAGSVLDDRGTLLPGIPVVLKAVGDAGTGPSGEQVTDANGMFTFQAVREGEYVIGAEPGQSYRPASVRVRSGIASAELRLQRIRSVKVLGLVSDPQGNPLDRVRVRVLGDPKPVFSDAGGTYEIEVDLLKAGQPPVLEFDRADYREQRQRVNAAVASDAKVTRIDVVLQPEDLKVALSGRIVGPGEEPVPGARVWLSSPDPRTYRETVAGRFGDYRFDQVEVAGNYRAGVEAAEGYQAMVSGPFEVGPNDTVHDLSLLKSGEGVLSGLLVDPQGDALSGFSLWLQDVGSSGAEPLPVRADAQGRFIVDAAPAGPLEIQTRSEPVLEASGITLSPGEVRDVVVPLDWGPHWLFGQVVDGSGAPIAQARVMLQWRQQYSDVYSTSRREVSSDRLGYFTFSNLGAGDHLLTVLAPGYQTARTVQASGSANDQLQVVLQRAGGPGAGDGG